MKPVHIKLRPPSRLEVTFYRELLAPLHIYLEMSPEDPPHVRAATLLAIRFKKEMARYGYYLTEQGMMVQDEPDILDADLTIIQQTNSAFDMQILRRLTDR